MIYEFTNETLCKLAGGICDTPFLKLALLLKHGAVGRGQLAGGGAHGLQLLGGDEHPLAAQQGLLGPGSRPIARTK